MPVLPRGCQPVGSPRLRPLSVCVGGLLQQDKHPRVPDFFPCAQHLAFPPGVEVPAPWPDRQRLLIEKLAPWPKESGLQFLPKSLETRRMALRLMEDSFREVVGQGCTQGASQARPGCGWSWGLADDQASTRLVHGCAGPVGFTRTRWGVPGDSSCPDTSPHGRVPPPHLQSL